MSGKDDKLVPIDVAKTIVTLKKLPTSALLLAKVFHAKNIVLHSETIADMEAFAKQMDEISISIEDELYDRIGGNDKLLGSKPVWEPPEEER